jgi:hypothetical protein
VFAEGILTIEDFSFCRERQNFPIDGAKQLIQFSVW